jgi:hypothetical protein
MPAAFFGLFTSLAAGLEGTEGSRQSRNDTPFTFVSLTSLSEFLSAKPRAPSHDGFRLSFLSHFKPGYYRECHAPVVGGDQSGPESIRGSGGGAHAVVLVDADAVILIVAPAVVNVLASLGILGRFARYGQQRRR